MNSVSGDASRWPAPSADAGERYELLLVEDSPGDVDLIRERLSDVPGYRFVLTTAQSLAEAFRCLAAARFDGIVLDLHLPDSAGLATLEQLRARHPGVPVIVLSGDARPELRIEVRRSGAEEFIGKNEPASRLLARSILYALERHRAGVLHGQVRQLIAGSPDGIIVTDRNGRVLFVNEASARLFGRDVEELIGESIGFSVQDGQTLEIDVLRSGERRNAELRVVQCDWQDTPAFLATVRDITERNRLAEQLRHAQKLDAIGQLAGGVAHDFNNLLTVILACAEFSLDAVPADNPARRQIEEIQRAGRRAASLTHQLLTFARRRSSTPQVVDLNDVLANTRSMLERLLGAHIDIRMSLEPALEAILVDPDQMSQVIANLAVNARDAMPRGGILSFETSNQVLDEAAAREVLLTPGNYVRLRVQDTGVGMDTTVMRRLFEPFFTTKKEGGTGLGLSIVHGIVTQDGGQIAVDSAPGSGTTFTLYLPAVADEIDTMTPVLPPVVGGSERVLLVEDEPGVRDVVAQMLQLRGYQVQEAADGDQALAAVRAADGQFDLVLTDVVMPGTSGWALGQVLRVEFPDVKVIFMSGYSDAVIAQHGVTLTNDLVILQKPFSTETLLRTVRRALDH
jgi:signal transduction histidine kinase/DNA-binding LytR/AlgR family response regulator